MNSIVHFYPSILPCVTSDSAVWHAAHGWLWNVTDTKSGRFLGVVYCTRLCGAGVIIHFETIPSAKVTL